MNERTRVVFIAEKPSGRPRTTWEDTLDDLREVSSEDGWWIKLA
jgi:hypothetical protein